MAPESPAGDPLNTLRSLPMGRTVELESPDGRVWRGTLVPSHELSGERIVQLKLESGYNVGVRVEPTARIRVVEDGPKEDRERRPSKGKAAPAHRADRPWVALLTTGGTIASRVDYSTGAVRPVREEEEILAFYSDLERDGPVRIVPVSDRLSEEIGPTDWMAIAEQVIKVFIEGASGVVVAHGTDTLAFTSAALSFLLEDLPGPVVVVGAQRSPDRPSSDGFTNLTQATRLARHPELGEVVVLMHDGFSDDRFAIHRGTRVRKMHSSRRDAFRTRNGPPIGYVEGDAITLTEPIRKRSNGPARISSTLDPRGAILWFHPGLAPDRARAFVSGLRGVVIAGTGLGHVSLEHLGWIRDATHSGQVVVMTTQCLEGSTDPYVYATGRELERAGVVYAGDLLPETAYVKLLWALGRSGDPVEIRRLLLENRVGEFRDRHPPTELR